jgi:hypothetical protein
MLEPHLARLLPSVPTPTIRTAKGAPSASRARTCARAASIACAAVLLAPLATAQALYPAGNVLRTTANAFSRPAGLGPVEVLQRFDAEKLRGFGIEPAHPGMQVVRGMVMQVRDFGFSVPDGLFDVAIYGEDPSLPNHPDFANPLATALDIAGVPLAQTVVFFPTPALAPIGADVFVGIRLNAASTPIAGMRINTLYGISSPAPHDLAGAGLPTSPLSVASTRLYRDLTTNQVSYLPPGQFMVDLLTVAPAGFPTALTNQPHYVSSSVVPGCSTMLSGLHPDAASPPRNAGRADDVGFIFADPGLPPGSPVAFVASFAGFGPIVPLDSLVPGSLGGLCLDPAHLFPLGVAATSATFEAFSFTVIDPAVRPLLAGTSWVQQAISLDLANGTLRGTQCGLQRF